MSTSKRPASGNGGGRDNKRAKSDKPKGKKQWVVPRKNKDGTPSTLPTINAGDSGIWATCDMHKEAKCVGELKDMFYEYAEELYGDELEKMRKEAPKDDGKDEDGDGPEVKAEDEETKPEPEFDIEAEIAAEVKGLRKPTTEPLFTNVKVDVQCVLFLKTRHPIDPVALVHHVCRDLANNTDKRRTRFAKRLSPMTMMGKATEAGLETVARAVLAPKFHGKENTGKKFAIRPTIRNHGKILTRDYIIQTVASIVGPGHSVDLNNPDVIILVDVYKNICGMSVLSGPDFDELKRFNLAEIGMPPASAADEKTGKAEVKARANSEGVVKAEVKSEIKVEEDGKGAEMGTSPAPAADEKSSKIEDKAPGESDGVVKTEVKAEDAA